MQKTYYTFERDKMQIYTTDYAKWHEDYLKNIKWVQNFNNNKWQSFNDVARWYIAKHYELWIPDYIIEGCSGIAEIERIVKYLIKFKDGE